MRDIEGVVDSLGLSRLEGAGHSVAGDKPAEFVKAVSAFLSEVL